MKHKKSITRSMLRTFARSRWIRFAIRDRLLRIVHDPDLSEDEQFICDFYGGGVYSGNFKSFIDWSIFYYGAYSISELDCLASLISDKTNSVVLDVGANVGNHTLFLARKAYKVIAVEPFPEAIAQLKNQVRLNSISSVEIIPFALGDKDESLPYRMPTSSNQGVGCFVRSGHQDKTVYLPVRKGDKLIQELNITRLDLVKIDTEGFESFVLRGLHHSLEKFRPIVFFEWSTPRDGQPHLDSPASLFPLGYSFYHFSPPSHLFGLININHFRLIPIGEPDIYYWHAGNYVASPYKLQ